MGSVGFDSLVLGSIYNSASVEKYYNQLISFVGKSRTQRRNQRKKRNIKGKTNFLLSYGSLIKIQYWKGCTHQKTKITTRVLTLILSRHRPVPHQKDLRCLLKSSPPHTWPLETTHLSSVIVSFQNVIEIESQQYVIFWGWLFFIK